MDSSLSSKLDWTQNPASTLFSKIHANVLNRSGVTCDITIVSVGSILESKGMFDLDDLQIFSDALNYEDLESKIFGKIKDSNLQQERLLRFSLFTN